jgi:flagellar biosynthesis/type III secretory pathway protein FliH
MFIGQIPSKEDYDQFVSKLKKAGQEKTKEIEAAASKVMQQVEKAKKEGKGTADAYIKGLKEGELFFANE